MSNWTLPDPLLSKEKGKTNSLAYCLANLFGEPDMLDIEALGAEHLRDYGDYLGSLHELSQGKYRLSPLVVLPLTYPSGGIHPDFFRNTQLSYQKEASLIGLVFTVRDLVKEGGSDYYLRHVLVLAKTYAPGAFVSDPSELTGTYLIPDLSDMLDKYQVYGVAQAQTTEAGPDTAFAIGSFRPLLSDSVVDHERALYDLGGTEHDRYFQGPTVIPQEVKGPDK